MPHEIDSTQAFQTDSQLKLTRRSINENFLVLAKLLKEVRDQKYYEVLGHESFNSYIAQPELSLQRSSVYDLISIYEKYVEGYGVQPAGLGNLDWTKLAETLPYVNKKNHQDLLEKVESLSRSDLREELRQLRTPSPTPPEGLFDVIHCDLGQYSDLDSYRRLKIPTTSDATLFLWSSNLILPEALEIMKTWGFKYQTNLVWDKVVAEEGKWTRERHHILLIGIKGNPQPLRTKISSIYEERSLSSSPKPGFFYQMVEGYFPRGKYLEVFGKPRKGWSLYTNETI